MQVSHTLDRVAVTFDDDRAVADAGLILPAILAGRIGLEDAADAVVDRGYRPGRKVLTIVHAMLAGAACIDDCGILRSGATERVLGHDVVAPSTLGTWLRSFTFGHVRQLDRLAEIALTNAWQLGAGPGAERLVIDVDSTICEVCGHAKHGAAYGYTRALGYHPLLASRADTGEILHLRFRRGNANTQVGAPRFVRESAGRARRAGATGEIEFRFDSGFFSKAVIAACRDHGARYSITIPLQKYVHDAIEQIDEDAWQAIEYPDSGVAEVAETTIKVGGEAQRLIVRRVRNVEERGQLFLTWRHHAFVTDKTGDAVALDAEHRHHAVCELAIRDIKNEGLARCPSGKFFANSAWAVLATIAHNMLRWIAILGEGHDGLVVAKTIRRHLIQLPGRITRSARRVTLHLPTRWPWRDAFERILERLRSLPAPC
jgi:hypothetical protein